MIELVFELEMNELRNSCALQCRAIDTIYHIATQTSGISDIDLSNVAQWCKEFKNRIIGRFEVARRTLTAAKGSKADQLAVHQARRRWEWNRFLTVSRDDESEEINELFMLIVRILILSLYSEQEAAQLGLRRLQHNAVMRMIKSDTLAQSAYLSPCDTLVGSLLNRIR